MVKPGEPHPDDAVTLRYVNHLRYLGVQLDSKLLFGYHLANARNKAIAATSALYPLLARSSKLDTRTKLLLYKAVIRPIMLYASPVWSTAAQCHLKPLQIAQNRALKIIFKLGRQHPTRDLHERANIPFVEEYIGSLNERFFERCRNSEFPAINQLANNMD